MSEYRYPYANAPPGPLPSPHPNHAQDYAYYHPQPQPQQPEPVWSEVLCALCEKHIHEGEIAISMLVGPVLRSPQSGRLMVTLVSSPDKALREVDLHKSCALEFLCSEVDPDSYEDQLYEMASEMANEMFAEMMQEDPSQQVLHKLEEDD